MKEFYYNLAPDIMVNIFKPSLFIQTMLFTLQTFLLHGNKTDIDPGIKNKFKLK